MMHADLSTDGKESLESCPVCYEEISHDDSSQLKCSCNHKFCHACISSWIETCEAHKSSNPPRRASCPTCRQHINDWDLVRIVGHAFHPPKPVVPQSDYEDDLFRLWLREEGAQPCPRCGIWISRVDGCNHMRCICGATFCYCCGQERCVSSCLENYDEYIDGDLLWLDWICSYCDEENHTDLDAYGIMDGMKNSAGGKVSLRWAGNSRNKRNKPRSKANDRRKHRGHHRPSEKRSQRATIQSAF